MTFLYPSIHYIFPSSDVGIVVSIAAFQAVDPGSIPGHRKIIFFCNFEFVNATPITVDAVNHVNEDG